MSAASTTGTGPGSALKEGQRGPEDFFVGIGKLIGTRIVYSNSVTLASSSQNVNFPAVLPGVATDYIVITSGSPSYSWASSVTTNGFTLNGTSTQTVSYIVVKVTNATVVPASFPYA